MASSRKARSPDLAAQVEVSLDLLCPSRIPPPRICVALSGGVDSVVLLHSLVQLRAQRSFSLAAAHVNHGLSPNAGTWHSHCADVCKRWDVPFQGFKVNVPRKHPSGIEAAARELRHRALSGVTADWLALAHHRDDQAETLLFRLLRGTGVHGAGAIRPVERASSGPGLWRPLLGVSRADILAYAHEHELNWVEDESNADPAYTRNFLRLEVMPVLKKRFQAADATLARAALLFDEADQVLQSVAAEDAVRCAVGDDCGSSDAYLDHTRLAALGTPRLTNLLRYLLGRCAGLPPDERRLREAVRQLVSVGTDHPLRQPLGNAALCAYRGRVWLEPCQLAAGSECAVSPDSLHVPWGSGQVRFKRMVGEGIDPGRLSAQNASLCLRPSGERVQMRAAGPTRTFKNLLQEAGVPPWQRPVLPVLRIDGQVAWVAGVGVVDAFRCRPGEVGVMPVWDQYVAASHATA